VANAKARDFEIHEPLKEAAARWLDLVPAEHRHEGRESAKDALETLQEHTRSCPDHPLGALWVAHRHLKDPVPAVRIAALVLASEALWWLGHFEDARSAAQAAADADPASAQALWRLAVALYRLGRFEEASQRLDDLLEVASRFAPGWALRGQVKVWLDAGNPKAGRADFAAAAALTSGSGTWVVPYRMTGADFQAQADAEVRVHDSKTGGSSDSPVDVVLLPDKSRVELGVDPDRPPRLPRRREFLVRLSRKLPVPALFGLRLVARRPRRAILSAANIAVTVMGLVAALSIHAGVDNELSHFGNSGGLVNPDIPGQAPPECERHGPQQDNGPFPVARAGEAAEQVVAEHANDTIAPVTKAASTVWQNSAHSVEFRSTAQKSVSSALFPTMQ
jgi:hypothetical protein